MANEDFSYKATLNIQDILSGLTKVDKETLATAQRIDAHFKKAGKSVDGLFIDKGGRIREASGRFSEMGNAAAKGFEAAEKGAQASGVQIGAIAGVVDALATSFINLGVQAIGALINIGKEFVSLTEDSVKMAAELETSEKVFTGIFAGNADMAEAALGRVRKESRGLGIDLSETARAFLPFVGSLDELSKVNKAAAALAIAQPEQGATGARIALQEALSGNMSSLVKRFEIPKALGKELQTAMDEGGVAAFLEKFEDVMKRMGRNIDALTDTIQFKFGQTQQNLSQLQTAFGVPITDELKGQLEELNKVLDMNYDDFEGLATLAGDVVSEFLDAFDLSSVAQFFADNKQDLAEFLTALKIIVINAKDLADIDISAGFNIDTMTTVALKIDKIVIALDKIKNISSSIPSGAGSIFGGAFTGALEGVFPLYTAFIKIWENLDKVILSVMATYGLFVALAAKGQAALNNSYQEFLVLTGQISENQKKIIDPQKAYDDVIKNVNANIKEYKKSVTDAAVAVAAATIPVKESTDAAEDQADAFLAARQAADKLAKLEDDYASAKAKVNEETTKAQKDFQQTLEDIDIATERKRLDIAIEFAQKREDAARNNLEKIADIRKKYSQDVDDAAVDLGRKEEDIARKFGQNRIDLEKEQRQKRVDIEKDYRLKLQDIQRQFLLDADEAESKRDAIAFLRAMKERDTKVQDAQTDRQRTIQEAQITNQQKRDELALQYVREFQDAHIANERKLEDLRTNLDRQIEAQNTAYARQLDDLTTAEQRKNEELNLSRERDIEDANKAYARKLEDLKTSLAEELKIIQDFAAQKAAALAEAAPVSTFNPHYTNATVPAGTSHGPSGNFQQRFASGAPFMASGGLVGAGRPFVVGERGAELFVPSQNGKIIPNHQLLMPALSAGGSSYSVTNNNQRSASLGGLLDANNLDTLLAAKVQNVLLNILGGL